MHTCLNPVKSIITLNVLDMPRLVAWFDGMVAVCTDNAERFGAYLIRY